MSEEQKAAKGRREQRRRVRRYVGPDAENLTPVDSDAVLTGPAAEATALASTLAPRFGQLVEFYAKEYAGSGQDPRQMAEDLDKHNREQAAETPPEKLTWNQISAVARADFPAALALWEGVKDKAREELALGSRILDAIMPQGKPMERARFIAILEEMDDGWKSANGVEYRLIEMLGATYTLWLHWTELSHTWATQFAEEIKPSSYTESRSWKPPRVSAAEAAAEAHRYADSYNRQFLRVLRQLRDLRRYSPPVIVNNGGQVNLANQQVNVSGAQT